VQATLLVIAVTVNIACGVFSILRLRQRMAQLQKANHDLQRFKDDLVQAASLTVLLADARMPTPDWIRQMALEMVTPELRSIVKVDITASDRPPTELVH